MPKIKVLPHASVCPNGAEIEAVKGKSICDNLLEHHIDIEHACEKQAAAYPQPCSVPFSVRAVAILSNVWPDIWKSPKNWT